MGAEPRRVDQGNACLKWDGRFSDVGLDVSESSVTLDSGERNVQEWYDNRETECEEPESSWYIFFTVLHRKSSGRETETEPQEWNKNCNRKKHTLYFVQLFPRVI